MKELSILNVLAATLAVVVSSQVFAEEHDAPNAVETEESNTEAVTEISTKKSKERDYDFYVSVGTSMFREDISSAIGDGDSFRLTFGYQFRKWFGYELFEERTPALETKSIIADLRETYDNRLLDYSITTKGNKVAGHLAKFSYELNDTYTLVAKVGIAHYEAHRIVGRLTLADNADHSLFSYRDLDNETDGFTPVFSLGMETPFPYPDSEKTAWELLLVHMSDKTINSTSLRLGFKYTF